MVNDAERSRLAVRLMESNIRHCIDCLTTVPEEGCWLVMYLDTEDDDELRHFCSWDHLAHYAWGVAGER
jgi:hypothetical protein